MSSTKSRLRKLCKMGTATAKRCVATATENISIHQDELHLYQSKGMMMKDLMRMRGKTTEEHRQAPWKRIKDGTTIMWKFASKLSRLNTTMSQRLWNVRPPPPLRFQKWFSCPLHSPLFLSSLKHRAFVCLVCWVNWGREKTETAEAVRPPPPGLWLPAGTGRTSQGRLEANATKRRVANTGRGNSFLKKPWAGIFAGTSDWIRPWQQWHLMGRRISVKYYWQKDGECCNTLSLNCSGEHTCCDVASVSCWDIELQKVFSWDVWAVYWWNYSFLRIDFFFFINTHFFHPAAESLQNGRKK